MRLNNLSRSSTVLVLLMLFASGAAVSAVPRQSLQVEVTERSFGTLGLDYAIRVAEADGLRLDMQSGFSLPLVAVIRGAGLDSWQWDNWCRLDWRPVPGLYLGGRLGTALSGQEQVMGSLTGLAARFGLRPGIAFPEADIYALADLDLGIALWYRASALARNSFADLPGQDPLPDVQCFGLPSARLRLGVGASFRLPGGRQAIGVEAGMIPHLNPDIGLMDGMSFGELPFFCRLSLGLAW